MYIYTHPQGETPLIVASARGDLFDMRLLMAAGCDCNATSHDGATALMEAAAVGYIDCVKFLVEHQANVKLADKVGLY